MSRTDIAILAFLSVLLAGCGGVRPGAEGAVRSHAAGEAKTAVTANATLSPAEHCQAVVLTLLTQTVQAMQDGYQGGIDVNQVMARYGAQSVVFQAFAQLDGQVIAWVDEHGPAGAIGAVQHQALQLCQQDGA